MQPAETSLHRRSIRLPGFDYSQAGLYFVTICAFEKKCIFGEMRGDIIEPSPIGKLVVACWLELPKRFAHVELDSYVLMPNHLHGLLIFHQSASQNSGRSESFQKPVRGSLPTVVRSFKADVSQRANVGGLSLPHPVWQRGFFERVLRNGKEFTAAQRYILENPARWNLDHENPEHS